MPDRDRLMMSPIEKWVKYQRFPYKLLFHSLLVAITWIQLLTVVSQFTNYYRANHQTFIHYFLHPDDDDLKPNNLYSVEEIIEWINKNVITYYTIDDSSLEKFSVLIDPKTGVPKPIEMELTHCPTPLVDNGRLVTDVYHLTKEYPLGPLNMTQHQLKSFLQKVDSIVINFWFISKMPTQYASAPFSWHVESNFDREGGMFIHSISTARYLQNRVLLFKVGWISVLVILISTICTMLGIRSFLGTITLYRRTKSEFEQISRDRMDDAYEVLQIESKKIYTWREIPLFVKLDFFSTWTVVEVIGEILISISSFMALFLDNGLPISDTARVLTGIGCLIISSNMIKYLEYWKEFNTLVLTLQGAFMKNVRFLVSVVPLYLGYVACGHLVFGPYSDDFQTVDQTAVTLFALLNGDSIKDVFEELHDQFPWAPFSRIYLYSFIILFITAILNIFILMIEDAYVTAKDIISMKEDRFSRRSKRRRDQAGFIIESILPAFDLPTLFDIIDEVKGTLSESRIKKLKKLSAMKNMQDILRHESSSNVANDGFISDDNFIELEDDSIRSILLRNRDQYREEMEKEMNKLQEKYLGKLRDELEESMDN